MTIEIANSYSAQDTNAWLGLSNALAQDWKDLIKHTHLVFGKHTGHLSGHVFDPPWETSNTSLKYDPGTGTARSLDEIQVGGFVERELSSSNVEIVLAAISKEATIDYIVTNLDTATQIGSDTFGAASFGTQISSFTTARSDVVDGSGRPQMLEFDIQARDKGNADNAKIWQLRAAALEVTSSSDLPTG